MTEWKSYPQEKPEWDNNKTAAEQQPKWFQVKYIHEDSEEIGKACWWLGTWYCFSGTVTEWKE